MLQVEEHHHVSVSSERSFGVVFCIVFALIFLWPLLFGDGNLRLWAAVLSAAFLAIAFIKPTLLKPLNKVWFAFGMLLGKVVAPIVMMFVFAITVIPIGWLARRMGKDTLLLNQPSPERKSFWVSREGEPQSTMKNQF